jgi:hypothetical protein
MMTNIRKAIRRAIPNLFLLTLSIALPLLLGEVAYRTYKALWSKSTYSFRLAPLSYGQFDPLFGQRYHPGSSFSFSLIQDGRVVWCSGTVSAANGDGLTGRATLADAKTAPLRLLTSGDSVSHWQRNGVTIPDIAQDELRRRGHTGVTILNYSRGGYGVLHMLTIASSVASDVLPQRIVFQFITDDLTRGRWWSREAQINGRTRAQLSPSPNSFDDFRITNDKYIVDARADDAWCRRQMTQPEEDSVLRDAVAFHRSYMHRKGLSFNPWSLKRSYLADYFYYKLTGEPLSEVARFSIIPRVDAVGFASDAGYVESVEKLRRIDIPVVLIHLPTKTELDANKVLLNREQKQIWQQLEKDFNTRIHTYSSMQQRPTVPSVIDLLPFDGHPNYEGLLFYGAYVAEVLNANLSAKLK